MVCEKILFPIPFPSRPLSFSSLLSPGCDCGHPWKLYGGFVVWAFMERVRQIVVHCGCPWGIGGQTTRIKPKIPLDAEHQREFSLVKISYTLFIAHHLSSEVGPTIVPPIPSVVMIPTPV